MAKDIGLKEPKISLQDVIAEEVGIGVHTALRKYCWTEAANRAWRGINDMPDKEWNSVCDAVAEEIIKRLQEREPHSLMVELLLLAMGPKKGID